MFRKTRQELRLRNYSLKAIKSYLGCLGEYFDFKKYFNLAETEHSSNSIWWGFIDADRTDD